MNALARRFFLALLIGLPWLGVGKPVSADEHAITVAAAASLTDVVTELGRVFEAETGTRVRASFASSAVSARQIINGAPFDVLISANRAWIDEARDREALIAESAVSLAGNCLVVAGSAAMLPGDLATLVQRAAAEDWQIAIADPAFVPAGIYARQALERAGLWQAVEPRLVRLPNVRSVVAFTARGETPIGLVYATDLAVAPSLRVLTDIDATLHPPIEYVGAVAVRAPSLTHARAFLAFVRSDAGQAIVQAHGFKRADEIDR